MYFLVLCFVMPSIAIAHAWCPDNQPLDWAVGISMGMMCCAWWDYRCPGWAVLWAFLGTSEMVATPTVMALVILLCQPWVMLLIMLVGNFIFPRRCPFKGVPTRVWHVTYLIRKEDLVAAREDTGPYQVVCGACGRRYTMVLHKELAILRFCPVCAERALRVV